MRRPGKHRSLFRKAAAWLALGSLAAALLLPAIALAAGNLVSSYDVPSFWSVGGDDEDSFSASGYYGPADEDADAGWDGEASVYVTLRAPENQYTGQPDDRYFSSFEDFAARSGGSETLYGSGDEVAVQVDYVWSGAQKTTLGGLEAWSNVGVYHQYSDPDNGVYSNWHQAEWQYFIPLGDTGIYVTGGAWAAGDASDGDFGPIMNDVESAIASLRFNASGASAGGVPGTGGDTSPWRTVTGGIGAVAAAAIAMAGAMASARAKSGAEEPPPSQPVGYVLQLSTRRLTVSAEHSATFTAQAFKVLPDGSFQPANDAALVLHLPAGVSVQPQTAYGTLQTTVWQTGEIALGSAITVEAQSALGATTAAVTVAAAAVSRIVTRIEPAGTLALRTQGDHSITLVAAVELQGADAENPALDREAIRATIAFDESSEWLEISEAVDYEDGRAITVMASQPDPTNAVQPPESATVRVTAQIGERPLTELVAIPLAGLPEMDAKPDQVEMAAESGAAVEIAITITNAGDTPWQFDTVWREGSRAIVSASIEPSGPSAATLTLTEDGGKNLDATRPQTASTLVVVATAEGYDELRRHVDVMVTQEGLFLDRTNVDPATGAFPVAADGSARRTAIDLRVYVRDPATGDIAPDIALAEQTTLEIGGQEQTSGHAGLKAAGLVVEPAGVRQLNVPSATFDVSLERKLPTDGEPVPAALRASVPGQDSERFSALVPLRLLGVNMAPYSDAWETERDNCLDIIREFVPHEHQDRLYALVAERSLTMGTEGLFYMRKQIWSFAYDQLMIEKHEHLDAAWWYEQVENTLEWVSWCGDIAMGVISGTAVGVVGGMALGLLKPLLVSAMEVWLAGGSLEDWLMAQSSMLTGFIEGALTDPDFLTKLSGEKKAIGWALFIAYYFAKELYNDPQMSVTNAAKRVAAQIRDEGLIRFLQYIVGLKGGAPKKAKAGADAGTPDGPHTRGDAGTPDAGPGRPKSGPDAPDAAVPRTPDADAPRTPADAGTPDAPAAKSTTDAGTPDATAAKTPDADAPRTPADAGTPDVPAAEPRATSDADAHKPADADSRKPGEADSTSEKTPEKPEKPAEKKTPEKLAEKAPDGDVDPRTTDPDPKVRADGISKDIASKTSDGKPLDVPTVERIMRDPDAMRELRAKDPEAWRKFNETRQKVYKSHDAELRDWAKKNLPEGQDHEIAVHTVGHVDGVDRDYRLGYFVKDPQGRHHFIEIPREKWAGESQRIFSEKTGGPSDPRGAEKWASERQQLQTDYTHEEASIDMADQGTIYDPETDTWQETRMTPNDQMVKDGRSTLIDPKGYGKTYETKVMNSYKQGNTLDAYTQADKAVTALDKVRHGYTEQGYRVDDLTPELMEGGNVVHAAKTGRISIDEANAQLARLGYEGGLPDFMDRVSKSFGDLGSATR